MAEPVSRTRCPECQRLRVRVAELEAQLAAARKHSGNSSKPPSSDIVKPPTSGADPKDRKRRRGGQAGHPRHERPAFPPEALADSHDHTLEHCPDCGGSLEAADAAPRVIQQVEIVEKPIRIEQHRGLPYWCSKCQKLHYAPLPVAIVKAGLVGPRLTALVGFLKSVCHGSFSTIRKFLRDVVGVTLSRGQLAKLVQKVSASLQETYDALRDALPGEARLNVDETGHPDQGDRLWTWCFRAPDYTLFCIAPSRGSDVLIEVLGQEFDGLLGCDYFSAYRKYMKGCHVAVQFCLAHLIRDVKFLVEHPNRVNQRYGKMLLEHLRQLFGIIHRRADYASAASFRRALSAVRNRLVGDALMRLPDSRQAENLADRFVLHADSYFRFITSPEIEPTNNAAEQAIRFVAIHRRMTQGTRGSAGQRWCERIWSVVGSCAQQGRSVFEFLCQAIGAHFQGTSAPSLLPNSS
jgi:transposase